MNTCRKESNTSLFREAAHSPTRNPQGMQCFEAGAIGSGLLKDSVAEAIEPGRHNDGNRTKLSMDGELPGQSELKPEAFDMEKLAQGARLILEAVGEDADREGLIETPARVARMYRELLYGTGSDPAQEITCHFNEGDEDPVIVKDMPFATICEHHLVPFIGKAHVAYLPKDGRITGLSKLARVVELAARRLQVQERMTSQIADALMRGLSPQGVLVILEAEHLCMSIRGVKKSGSITSTIAARGIVKQDAALRRELLMLIKTQ